MTQYRIYFNRKNVKMCEPLILLGFLPPFLFLTPRFFVHKRHFWSFFDKFYRFFGFLVLRAFKTLGTFVHRFWFFFVHTVLTILVKINKFILVFMYHFYVIFSYFYLKFRPNTTTFDTKYRHFSSRPSSPDSP